MSMIGNPRISRTIARVTQRSAWIALLVIAGIAAQITPAAACHDDWSWAHKVADPAGYAFCKYVFAHFDSSGTGPDTAPSPGFNVTLPDDSSRAGLPNLKETACFPKPTCAQGFRTFCVNPKAAAPACCHAWRTCEKAF